MSREKILVVEDEPDIRTCIAYTLQNCGYQVFGASDGEEGLAAIRRSAPDLIVLDRMLPDADGMEICRNLRADPRTSAIRVVIVSARDAEQDVVVGLGDGADDYVTKPFRPAELAARVAAVLRRGQLRAEAAGTSVPRVSSGPVLVDLAAGLAELDSQSLNLHPVELRLLHLLASEPGRVFTRSQILDRVVAGGPDSSYRNADHLVTALRRKLGIHGHLIETVRDLGYRMRDTNR